MIQHVAKYLPGSLTPLIRRAVLSCPRLVLACWPSSMDTFLETAKMQFMHSFRTGNVVLDTIITGLVILASSFLMANLRTFGEGLGRLSLWDKLLLSLVFDTTGSPSMGGLSGRVQIPSQTSQPSFRQSWTRYRPWTPLLLAFSMFRKTQKKSQRLHTLSLRTVPFLFNHMFLEQSRW